MQVDVRGSYSWRGRRWYKKTHISFGYLFGPTNISAISILPRANHPLNVEAVENTGSASLAMSV